MSNSGNLYERVDGVESKVDDVSAKMDSLSAKIDGLLSVKQTTATPQTENPQAVLRRFISKSKKEYCWFGNDDIFNKQKKHTLMIQFALIGVIILATIFTSVAYKMYTTFSFFENIWLLMTCFLMHYTSKATRIYNCSSFALKSCFNFEFDADGVLRKGAVKKKYKAFFILACICAIANIVIVWTKSNTIMSVISTILELAVLGVSIYGYFVRTLDFFDFYTILRFTGENETTGQRVVLFFDTISSKLYTEEEYLKQFSFCK